MIVLKNTVKELLVNYQALLLIAKYIFKFSFFCLNKLVYLFLYTLDFITPKSSNIWIFPVHFFTHTFSDNARAVYEEIKNDENIKKIIFTRNKIVSESLITDSTIIVTMLSWEGIYFFLRAKIIFVQHSVWLDFSPLHFGSNFPFSFKNRLIVNLWHGIPLKSITAKSTGISNKQMNKEKVNYLIPASSKNDQIIYIDAFSPISPNNVFVSGAPRNDFLKISEDILPLDYKKNILDIRLIKKDKKLIVYAPTYREIEYGGKCYEFSVDEIKLLKKFLSDNNAILGIRLHYYNRTLSYNTIFDNEFFFDFDQSIFPDMAMIIRESDFVISDYSGLVIDCVYNDTILINFAYDFEHYKKYQRGFSFSLEKISPLPLVYNFKELMFALENMINNGKPANYNSELIREIYFEFNDANNSKRLVNKIKLLA